MDIEHNFLVMSPKLCESNIVVSTENYIVIRMDQVKDDKGKVIDRPIVPELKLSPKRAIICIVGTITGFLIAVALALALIFRKQVSINYMEGLEWVMNYYTSGCIDWRWKYNYNYPPLLSDLIKYIPQWECNFLEKKSKNPVTSQVQLAYVLPRSSLYLIPNNKYLTLLKHVPEYYENNGDLQWAFCKYIWESHAVLPDIDIENLEYLLNK